ncbi:hypothetical protein NP493_74g05065 [Ridgeia piscesae]|uniref:Secreted protein n=1 Tax=Ridgeia piscesae TaxID=27915 RepID=A0AAD9UIJ4_RIDPI|nr:hypothetical protein NP493_74g05065 [Ridgeia piscesae]
MWRLVRAIRLRWLCVCQADREVAKTFMIVHSVSDLYLVHEPLSAEVDGPPRIRVGFCVCARPFQEHSVRDAIYSPCGVCRLGCGRLVGRLAQRHVHRCCNTTNVKTSIRHRLIVIKIMHNELQDQRRRMYEQDNTRTCMRLK